MLYQNFLTPDLGVVRTGAEIKKALKTVPGVESVTINSRKGMIEVEGEFDDGGVEAKLEALGLELVVVSPVVDLDLDA
ncbi:MAG: heavy metal-associated domain-containing protein [Anaerobiospirillum sp.]|nr:heavy metal-associated domain-containing protein [Anaerobiospirillum sp.]